jgi:hypothetical protein
MSKIFVGMALAAMIAAATVPARAETTCGLNPYGDNFLSLRTGPGSDFGEILRMGPGTYFAVIGSRGAWRLVRLPSGVQGWAHSRWIC